MKHFMKVVQTTNEDYNKIQEMLNDESVSNEDVYERMTKMLSPKTYLIYLEISVKINRCPYDLNSLIWNYT